MGVWLFHRHRRDPDYLRGAILAVSARRMVVSSGLADPVQAVACFELGMSLYCLLTGQKQPSRPS
jgi:hypothetical protein